MSRIDKSALSTNPLPTRTSQWVLVNECKGYWELAPASLMAVTQAQMEVLGRLYDWKMIRQQEGGVPAKMLKTNDSTLAPLKQRQLIKVERNVYYRLTELGRRTYDLKYWHTKHTLDERRELVRERREARQQFMYGNSANLVDPRQFRGRK